MSEKREGGEWNLEVGVRITETLHEASHSTQIETLFWIGAGTSGQSWFLEIF